MKKLWSIALLLGFFSLAQACPTCVSSAHDYSPPFFSDEFYQLTEERDAQVTRSSRLSSHKETNEEYNSNDSSINAE